MSLPNLSEKTVLVIDDNSDCVETYKLILEFEGFKVLTALGGEEALTILSQVSDPDLILLDLRMEGMSGLEFLTALEERSPETVKNVPVVFLSGMNEIPPSKAVGFIQKPITLDKFISSVTHFITKVAPVS